MAEKLYEKFSWFRDDVKLTSQVGNKIRIKGRALYATVSKNDRKYIADELLRSARTLAGKPIDVNHSVSRWTARVAAGETKLPKPKEVGHVLDADYEDGYIEYVAEINDNEYVAKLRDRKSLSPESYLEKWGKAPIYGVSVDAVYRYPQSESERDDLVTPLGIQFIRLSLVEDPEKPGVQNTTIELMEMSLTETTVVGNIIKDFAPDLFETYEREVVNKMSENTEKEKPKFVVSNQDTLVYDPRAQYDVPRGEIPASEYTFGMEPEAEEAGPRTDAERAKAHFDISDEEWDAMSPEEKAERVGKLPERGSAKEEAPEEVAEGCDDDDEEEKKKKKKKADESSKVVIPQVEKIIFKPLEKRTTNVVIEVDDSQLDDAIEKLEIIKGKEELSEVKPLVDKKTDMSLKEQQDKELLELQTKQFRDRNDAEHIALRGTDEALMTKVNEVVEAIPKASDAVKEHVLQALDESKTSLMETIAELEAQNKTLADKCNELVDVNTAQEAAMETTRTALQVSIDALVEKDSLFEKNSEELKETIDEQKTLIEALETRLGEYEEFKTAVTSVHEGFEERIAQLEAFKEGYPAEKESIETKIAELEASIGGVKTKIEEIEAEPQENPLEEQVNKLEESLENLKTHVKPEFKAPENLDEKQEGPSVSLEVDPVKG